MTSSHHGGTCRRSLATLLAPLLAVLACDGSAPAPDASKPRPHLVLVVVDTLRADALGVLGSAHGTPRLDRLASESFVFTEAISPSTWTLPAMTSLMTSLYPSEHGLLEGESAEQVPKILTEEHLTLAEALQAGGYTTLGIVNQVFLGWKYGFGQGFDHYDAMRGRDAVRINRRLRRELDGWLAPPGAGSTPVESPDRAMVEADGAAATGAADAVRPFFLYLHYLDPHWPYNNRLEGALPGDLAAADDDPGVPKVALEAAAWVAQGDDQLRARTLAYLTARYALEVQWVDAAIGDVIDLLEERGLWDDTVLVVTSDHGEGFWEHEQLLHGHAPYEEQIRVPLLVRVPPKLGLGAGRRSELVGLMDIMPTLLDLAGLPIPPHCRGQSLVPSMRGEEDAGRALLVETGRERALRTRDAKLLLPRGGGTEGIEYYDLASDPHERTNLARPCEGPCRESVRRLQQLEETLSPAATSGDAGDVTPEEIEELRSLGYVGG